MLITPHPNQDLAQSEHRAAIKENCSANIAVINQQQRIVWVLGIISMQINGIKLQYMLFQQFDASCGVTHLSCNEQGCLSAWWHFLLLSSGFSRSCQNSASRFFFLISAAFCYAESSYPLFQFLGVFGCSHECQVSCWHHIHMDMNQFMYSKSERPVVTFSGGDSGFPLWTVNVRAHFSSTFSISWILSPRSLLLRRWEHKSSLHHPDLWNVLIILHIQCQL